MPVRPSSPRVDGKSPHNEHGKGVRWSPETHWRNPGTSTDSPKFIRSVASPEVNRSSLALASAKSTAQAYHSFLAFSSPRVIKHQVLNFLDFLGLKCASIENAAHTGLGRVVPTVTFDVWARLLLQGKTHEIQPWLRTASKMGAHAVHSDVTKRYIIPHRQMIP
jgi:hypothetical protein